MGKFFSRYRRCRLCWAVAVLFTVAAVFSAAWALAHVEHDCAGDGCAVCAQITFAQNWLRQLNLLAGAAVLLLSVWPGARTAARGPAFARQNTSLLLLRVRLNN